MVVDGKDKKHPYIFILTVLLKDSYYSITSINFQLKKKEVDLAMRKKKITFEMSNKTKSRLHILILYSGVKVNS